MEQQPMLTQAQMRRLRKLAREAGRTPQSMLRQLIEQVEYVAARGIARPDVVLERVEHAGQLLELNPYIGTPGRVTGTREWPIRHSPLTIIYRVRPSRIQVLAVVHQRQFFR